MPEPLTVTDLMNYLAALVREDEILARVQVRGEISNPMLAKSGHFYFSLKDAAATLGCVMWRSSLRGYFQPPQEGEKVLAWGHLEVYPPRGQVQLIVDILQPEGGVGDLYRQFEQIKARLQAEGLFDAARKRPLPPMPRRIGLITSATGAALRDFLRILVGRWPLADVLLVPSLVQGMQAPAALQAALYRLYGRSDIDVIVLARGGGSIEDLWAFNDEGLVRLIAQSPVPVVTGIGHETDFTLADFVADVRAATPTAAAASVVPDASTYRQLLDGAAFRLAELVQARLVRQRLEIDRLHDLAQRLAPRQRIREQRQRLHDLERRLQRSLQEDDRQRRSNLEALTLRLHALNPAVVLTRGYAIIQDEAGRVVQSVQQVVPDQPLTVRVADGTFGVRVGDRETGRPVDK